MNREKYTFCVIKLMEHIQKFKKWPRTPILVVSLEASTNHTCHQKANPSRETIP
jgi:hypothetical protein